MERSGYDSDMSDKQWENLQKYLPEPSTRGSHLRKWDQRIIINESTPKSHFVENINFFIFVNCCFC